jgi:hypothetical protein
LLLLLMMMMMMMMMMTHTLFIYSSIPIPRMVSEVSSPPGFSSLLRVD